MRRLSFAVALCVLTGCVSPVQPTPYQAAPPGGGSGYTETWQDERRVKVRFTGNWRTDRQTVEDGLLYRAAELAAQRKAPRFAVRDKTVERRVYETIDTPPFPSSWYRDRWRGTYGRFPPRISTWTVYTAVMKIELLPEGAEAPQAASLRTTQAVLDELGEKVRRPSPTP